jgi:hypothetical protein
MPKAKKKKLTEEQAIILGMWLQFAYEYGKKSKRKWSGGLSALENAEYYLWEYKIINTWGNKRPEIIW